MLSNMAGQHEKFSEWFMAQESPEEGADIAWLAWQKAVAIERERCASLAMQHFIPGHSVAGEGFALALVAKIRQG